MTARRTAIEFFTALLVCTANTTARASSPTLTTLATFTSAPADGVGPSRVAIGSGGVLYGTTRVGGSTNNGTVFSLTPPTLPGGAWTEAVLYNFTGGSDGGNPARVVIGSGGILYGTTEQGGTSGVGTVFSLTPPAAGLFGPHGPWTESVLHNFAGGSDGSQPLEGVVIGTGGVLYGTTSTGGSANSGTVFSLTPSTTSGGVWTEAVLYNFFSSDSLSLNPSGLVIGDGGILYGTTQQGGKGTALGCVFPPGGCGTVFSLSPPISPGSAWTQATLYTFSGGSDGASPHAGVVVGSGGVLYGTATAGGPSGSGAVFSLTPPSGPNGAWTESILYGVGGSEGVVSGAGGVLYSIIQSSPVSLSYEVISLTPPAKLGGAWTESDLYGFTNSGGSRPTIAGLVIGTDGVLYGAIANGGPAAAGTVYSVTPPTGPGGLWTGSVLYNFTGGSSGSGALTGLAIGGNGVLYGATTGGGTGSCAQGCGTIYSLTPPVSTPGAWTYSVLYRFTGGSDGAYPEAALVIGNNGVLYGTTYVGGPGPCALYGYPPGCGTVFSLMPPATPGGTWTEAVLHSFTSGNDGANPRAPLVIGDNGALYGTTQYGGPNGGPFPGILGYGTVFSLAPPASKGGAWIEAVLYNFEQNPTLIGVSVDPSGLVIDSGGVLYGSALFAGISLMDSQPGCGTVFSLTPTAENTLYSFNPSGGDGCGPSAGVVIGGAGVLYGTTMYGGSGFGEIFSLTPPASPGNAWSKAAIYSFNGAGGAVPTGVALGSGGVLYGTAQYGGSGQCLTLYGYAGCGIVFALLPPAPPDTLWVEATLYDFTGGGDGAYPLTGVVIGSGGALYGTTQAAANRSTVFSLNPGAGLLPSINPGGVVNAANYTAPIAPGSIASAFGGFLLSSPLSAMQSPLPLDLSDLSLQVSGGVQAPLFFVSGGQVSFQVPWELAGQQLTSLAATVNGETSTPQTVSLATYAPAIFATNAQGSGQGAILDASYHLVNASNPSTAGSTVLIFCTGLGPVTNQPPTGSPAPLSPLSWTLTVPTVTIGGLSANLTFYGLAPGYVGLYQVNAQVPGGLGAHNAVPVVLSMGDATSNTVTIAVQ